MAHNIGKEQIPVCQIMGVNIAAINMQWLMEFTKNNIKQLAGDYMCVSNVHTTVMAFEDAQYRNVQNCGVMAIPDGGPLSAVGRKRGFVHMKRTTGPSYMEEVFKISNQYGWKHFFYGSTEETLHNMKNELITRYPQLNIVGIYSPPFRKDVQLETEYVIKTINESGADFVWIGLGAPKQENWMHIHQNKIKGFMVGVGAGFDFFAGNIKRAPEWMQKNNLEWLFRLLQDPVRLFRRYLHTNFKFIWYAIIRNK